MVRRQKGFTLIELIIVIVILGILSAYAVPKYLSLARQARIATLKGVQGAVVSMASTVAALGGGGSNDTLTLPDGNIVVCMHNGYPSAKNNDPSCKGITGLVDVGNMVIEVTSNAATWKIDGYNNCKFTYLQAASYGQSPEYKITESDC